MNALRNLFNSIRGKAAQSAASGSAKLPSAGAAGGLVFTLAALGGIGYGVNNSMVTSTSALELFFVYDSFILFVLFSPTRAPCNYL